MREKRRIESMTVNITYQHKANPCCILISCFESLLVLIEVESSKKHLCFRWQSGNLLKAVEGGKLRENATKALNARSIKHTNLLCKNNGKNRIH